MEEDANRDGLDEFGLPLPKHYDGPRFDARDYFSDRFAAAKTLGEAIEMRGLDAFAEEVEPSDFTDDTPAYETKIGIAEFWAESTWHDGESARNIELERTVAALQEGDVIEIRRCPQEQNEYGYTFTTQDGSPLPFTPYHDYDDQFFTRALEECRIWDKPFCRVRSVTCFGGDNNVPVDPTFCWRVYSCKVTVIKRSWNPMLN